jgi:hypothetical protein
MRLMLCKYATEGRQKGSKDPSVLTKRALLSDRIAFQVDYEQLCFFDLSIGSTVYRGCNYYVGGWEGFEEKTLKEPLKSGPWNQSPKPSLAWGILYPPSMGLSCCAPIQDYNNFSTHLGFFFFGGVCINLNSIKY